MMSFRTKSVLHRLINNHYIFHDKSKYIQFDRLKNNNLRAIIIIRNGSSISSSFENHHHSESSSKIQSNAKHDSSWDDMFEQLRYFYHQNGSCRVPHDSITHKKLADWVQTQRHEYNLFKKGDDDHRQQQQQHSTTSSSSLTKDKFEKLENIGIDRNFGHHWHERLRELVDYKNRHGHCNVPQKYDNNPPLGRWVETQRKQYKLWNDDECRYSLLTRERIDMLNAIGFVWNVNDMVWAQRYDELLSFRSKHGHCNVPIEYEENPSLGYWVSSQRQEYKNWKDDGSSSSSTIMTKERCDLLNKINFTWNARDAAWQEKYDELVRYRARNGHVMVPEKDENLGKWVARQREQRKRWRKRRKPCSMTEERERQLNDVGFVWDMDDYRWRVKYDEVVEYKARRGGSWPKKSHRLGLWLGAERRKYRRRMEGKASNLTEERIELLRDIGVNLD